MMVYMDEQQVADYREGRNARLAREQDEALREIRRLVETLRSLAARYAAALPGGELLILCSQLLTQAERFQAAGRAREVEDDLVEAP